MVYTNNVPQGNQTIANSQPQIQANFGFIQTDLQVEHQFNGNVVGLTEGVHLKASMPNQADPGSLPTGTNGQYYVGAGVPKFYNTAANFIAMSPQNFVPLSGVATIAPGGGVFLVPGVVGDVSGYFAVWRVTAGAIDGRQVSYFFHNAATGNASIQLLDVAGSASPYIFMGLSSGQLQIINNGVNPHDFHYTGWYIGTL